MRSAVTFLFVSSLNRLQQRNPETHCISTVILYHLQGLKTMTKQNHSARKSQKVTLGNRPKSQGSLAEWASKTPETTQADKLLSGA